MKIEIEVPRDLLRNIVREVLEESRRANNECPIIIGRDMTPEQQQEIIDVFKAADKPAIVVPEVVTPAGEVIEPAETSTRTVDDLRDLARDKMSRAKKIGEAEHKKIQADLEKIWTQFGTGKFTGITDVDGAYKAVEAL